MLDKLASGQHLLPSMSPVLAALVSVKRPVVMTLNILPIGPVCPSLLSCKSRSSENGQRDGYDQTCCSLWGWHLSKRKT